MEGTGREGPTGVGDDLGLPGRRIDGTGFTPTGAPAAADNPAPGPAASAAGTYERDGGEPPRTSGRVGNVSFRFLGEEEGDRDEGGTRCLLLGDVDAGGSLPVLEGGEDVPAFGYL